MKNFKLILVLMMAFVFMCSHALAEGKKEYQEGRYLVIEGRVTRVIARSLVVSGQQYPISMFAVVLDKNGRTLSIQLVANIGKIDKAKVYVLGGKVEKIVVIENI